MKRRATIILGSVILIFPLSADFAIADELLAPEDTGVCSVVHGDVVEADSGWSRTGRVVAHATVHGILTTTASDTACFEKDDSR